MSANHVFKTHLKLGGQIRPLTVRVNRRAKRLILTVDPVLGEIFVTSPTKSAIREAVAFAHERSEWIDNQLNTRLFAKPFCEGAEFPYRGVMHQIASRGGARSGVLAANGEPPIIYVGGEPAHFNRRVTDWLKKQARESLTERADYYCERLGVTRSGVRVRDTRTRWGSCSSDRVLSFSWRLIMTPPEILDYVAAHECAHLVHMNHSPAFWRLLATLGVDARMATNWFRASGAELFAYGVQANTPDHPLERNSAASGSSAAAA